MRAKIDYFRHKLRTNLWLVPAVLVIASIFLSYLTTALDRGWYGLSIDEIPFIFTAGPDAAREILSTIAGSMITVTSLVFSMTLIALTLASSQLGPRLLTNFIGQRTTQTAIGIFIGTFMYALLTVRTVSAVQESQFVPHLSVAVALVLALVSVGWLIFFINHIAMSIQADKVIADLSEQLHQHLDRRFSDPGAKPRLSNATDEATSPRNSGQSVTDVPAVTDGYVEAIDTVTLVELATKHDMLIRLNYRAGHFAFARSAIATVWSAMPFDEAIGTEIQNALIVGSQRTPAQDVEFLIRAIVEIGVRALSPGVNDPYTAVVCVDRLGAALAHAMRLNPPAPSHCDDDGVLRLILSQRTFEGLIDAAFNEIRQSAKDNVSVIVRMLETLSFLATQCRTEEHFRALKKHADMVEFTGRHCADDPQDLKVIGLRIEQLKTALDEYRFDQPS